MPESERSGHEIKCTVLCPCPSKYSTTWREQSNWSLSTVEQSGCSNIVTSTVCMPDSGSKVPKSAGMRFIITTMPSTGSALMRDDALSRVYGCPSTLVRVMA